MKQAGFTLVEILVAVAVIVLLAQLATPPLSQWAQANERMAAAREMASSIRSARVAAITRNQVVYVQAIDQDWSKGWRMIADQNSNGPDPQDLLLVERALGGKARIVGNTKVARHIGFNGLGGVVASGNGTLHVCIKDQPVSHYRVVVAMTGQVRVVEKEQNQKLCG